MRFYQLHCKKFVKEECLSERNQQIVIDSLTLPLKLNILNQKQKVFKMSRMRFLDEGLQNTGNSCFFNSALQLFVHCLNISPWKQQTSTNVFNLLLKVYEKGSSKYVQELSDSIVFIYKDQSKLCGNDPVRVFSEIIQQSKGESQLNIKHLPKRMTEDYLNWADDNSKKQHLFSNQYNFKDIGVKNVKKLIYQMSKQDGASIFYLKIQKKIQFSKHQQTYLKCLLEKEVMINVKNAEKEETIQMDSLNFLSSYLLI